MTDQSHPKKALGQHWLHDLAVLEDIAGCAEITPTDTVLEVGPGLGTLTTVLASEAKQVVAVEFDRDLARQLPERVVAKNLQIIHEDILAFDFRTLPKDYKVVANIPYYLTSHLIRQLSETVNPPQTAVLLIQKEVAERSAAEPGNMSMLSITAQFYWDVSLGNLVPAELFTPPPKVDSQILILERHTIQPLWADAEPKRFFRLVKAGFGERRKMLRSSLSGGLHITKPAAEELLKSASIEPTLRAQALSLEDWYILYGQAMQKRYI